jgi:hypothetical protein
MDSIYSPDSSDEDHVGMKSSGRRLSVLTLGFLAVVTPGVTAQRLTSDQSLGREILAELIGINTTLEHGSTTPAAEAVARRLLAAGFPAADVQVVGPV